jgi:hypothetical protein
MSINCLHILEHYPDDCGDRLTYKFSGLLCTCHVSFMNYILDVNLFIWIDYANEFHCFSTKSERKASKETQKEKFVPWRFRIQ